MRPCLIVLTAFLFSTNRKHKARVFCRERLLESSDRLSSLEMRTLSSCRFQGIIQFFGISCEITETFSLFNGVQLVESHRSFIPLFSFDSLNHLLKEEHIHDFKIERIHRIPISAANLSALHLVNRSQSGKEVEDSACTCPRSAVCSRSGNRCSGERRHGWQLSRRSCWGDASPQASFRSLLHSCVRMSSSSLCSPSLSDA